MYSITLPTPPFTVISCKTFKIISLELTPLCNAPVSFTFTTFGIFKLNGRPAIAQATSSPPAPIANAPIPPAVGV